MNLLAPINDRLRALEAIAESRRDLARSNGSEPKLSRLSAGTQPREIASSLGRPKSALSGGSLLPPPSSKSGQACSSDADLNNTRTLELLRCRATSSLALEGRQRVNASFSEVLGSAGNAVAPGTSLTPARTIRLNIAEPAVAMLTEAGCFPHHSNRTVKDRTPATQHSGGVDVSARGGLDWRVLFAVLAEDWSLPL